MTTLVWSSSLNATTTADFRANGSNLSSRFASIGLIQTSDTGQINWTTVTSPGQGLFAGYEIWRFSDSSVFIRIDYGCSSTSVSALGLALRLSVGSGSNGSGTLTGATVTDATTWGTGGTSPSMGNFFSYMVLTPTFFAFFGWKNARNDGIWAGMAIAKTTDANGNANNVGVVVYWGGVSNTSGNSRFPNAACLNFQTNVASNTIVDGQFCVVPQNITSSVVDTDTQCFAHWGAFPRVYPTTQVCSVLRSETPALSTFTTTIVGTTPRRYLILDDTYYGAINDGVNNLCTYRLAILWE
jgi:hypothetical protein